MPAETAEELSPRLLMHILGDFANSQILDPLSNMTFSLSSTGASIPPTKSRVKRERTRAPRASSSTACRR